MGRKLEKGVNDLATVNPGLARQWHPTKNGALRPFEVTCGSHKKVWWRCEQGHEWEAEIKSRSSGCGCPYCANKRVIVGETDLATTHPDLVTEWYHAKNDGLMPTDVVEGSNKKVFWKCNICGHIWKAKIKERVRGTGCPVCAGQKVVIGINDLAFAHPEIAAQWHPVKNGDLKPTDVTVGSSRKIWWMCEHGHEWKTAIYNRAMGKGCPTCSNKKLLVRYNDLATTHPELAKEWNPTKNDNLKPVDVMAGSRKKVWWLCEYGHEWEATIGSRIKGYGCPYCCGRYSVEGRTDLATIHPRLTTEWHPTKNIGLTDKMGRDISSPNKVSENSAQKVWWICKHDHVWKAAISSRVNGHGCPYCAKRIPIVGENDFKSLCPDVAKEWNYEKNKNLKNKDGCDISTPDKVTANSGQKVWWICEHGHEWFASIVSRVRGNLGCPICSKSKGEKAIRKILENNNIAFEEQYKFKDRTMPNSDRPLRDDFVIFDKYGKVVGTIEYNGLQHYEPVDFAGKGPEWAQKELKKTQARDKVKSDYLAVHNIPQLIIPYWDFNNVETLITNFIKIIY